MLSGTTATGLLQTTSPCPVGSVWTGMIAWAPQCGTRTIILSRLGTATSISGSTATAYHASGSLTVLAANSEIYEGDIIQTDATTELTIVFADASLLRIAPGSTVSLDTGTRTDGTSIAYAILQSGELWWRVISSSGGYMIGAGDIMAWVRGTAVSLVASGVTVSSIAWDNTEKKYKITYTGTPDVRLAVIHSTRASDAVTITCKGRDILSLPHFSVLSDRWDDSCPSSATETYTSAAWLYESPYNTTDHFRTYTIADLAYMTGTTGVSTDTRARILAEYDATHPTTETDKKSICGDTGEDTIYWENLLGTHFRDPCIDERVIAIADYTSTNASSTLESRTSLYRKSGSPLSNIGNPTSDTSSYLTSNGIKIDENGEYISYNDPSFLASLWGKKVTIELTAPTQNWVILHMWQNCKISKKNTWWYNNGWHCQVQSSVTDYNNISISIPLSLSPIQYFYIGNQSGWNLPIKATIRKIIISSI